MKVILFSLFVLFFGCQGMPSNKPPIHLNPNMDNQERFDPQEENSFFDNNMSMRMPVEGTIPRGFLDDNSSLFYGKDEEGNFVDRVSDLYDVDKDFILRGQERYNIYCTACHGHTGEGNGLVAQNDQYPLIPTSIYSSTLDDKTDGYFFDVISNGVRNMPGYSHQIEIKDRWAIVSYLRALRFTRENRNNE
tara:strand:+ start:219 stop:791 length:573 start_codon:yes stop_codon:yes gene_type:complete